MVILKPGYLCTLTEQIFRGCGAPAEEAAMVADHLVTANLMGLDSHGIIRIPQYVQEVEAKAIIPGAPVTILKESESTVVVDCGWNFGQVGAVRAMEIAMGKASKHHASVVVTRRCGHVGRLGAYTQVAAQGGFLALAFCTSSRQGHFVLPWGGREPRLSPNPISFGIPTDSGDPILADFSTSAAPEGKIRLYRDQGKQLPEGWIVDAEGRPTTDPRSFYGPPRGAILPFGGATGYRGYALALLVEVLGNALAGQSVAGDHAGNGVAFILIDISAFLDRDQSARLIADLKLHLKSCPPAEGFEEVLLPGEPEFRTAKRLKREGISVEDGIWQQIQQCAKSLGVSCQTSSRST